MLLNAASFLGVAVLMIAVLAAVGYAPALIVSRDAPVRAALIAPAVGIVVLIVLGGIGALLWNGPLRYLWAGIALSLVGLGAVLGWRTLRRWANGPRSSPREPRAFLFAGTLMLAMFGFWVIRWYDLWAYGALPAVSWNNDILSYAYMAKVLFESGLSGSGWIIGFDAGAAARGDVLGAYVLLGTAALVTGDPLSATLPTMWAVNVSASLAAFAVMWTLSRGRALVSIVVALLVNVVSISGYQMFQYFLAEKIAIAVALAVVAVVVFRPGVMRLAAAQAGAVAALALAYPQFIPIETLVVFAATILTARPGRLLSWREAGAVVVGTAVGAGLLGPYLLQRIERARALVDAPVGWSMPNSNLLDGIGLNGIWTDTGIVQVALGAVAIAGVVVMAILLLPGRRARSGLVAIAFLTPLSVYAWLMASEPDSYRQWKAFAVASPFLVLAAGVALVLATDLLRLLPLPRASRLASAVAVVLALAWIGVAAERSWNPAHDITACQWGDCPIGDDVRATYARLDGEAGSGPIGVWFESGWDGMTASYLLWGRPTVMKSPSYWPTSDAPVTKTLTPGGWVD
jgi:hypothetical protein